MTQFATWDDYTGVFLRGRTPAIPQAEFDYWSEMASDMINRLTFSRIDDAVYERYNREIIRAACALADFYYTPAELSEFKGYKSVSVTGHSVSLDDRTQGDIDVEARALVRRFLGDTGLMYRGV